MPASGNKRTGPFDWPDYLASLFATNRELTEGVQRHLQAMAPGLSAIEANQRMWEQIAKGTNLGTQPTLEISRQLSQAGDASRLLTQALRPTLPSVLETSRGALEQFAKQANRPAEQLIRLSPAFRWQPPAVLTSPSLLQQVQAQLSALSHVASPSVWLTRLMGLASDGFPVIWVAPEETLDRLLIASGTWEARTAILLEDEEAVLNLIETRLAECTRPELQRHVWGTAEALRSYRRRCYVPAQILAAAVVDDVGCTYQLLKGRLPRLKANPSPANWRERAVLAALEPAWVPWKRGGQPLLDTFNRHATIHEPRPEHFGRGTDLVALMVLVSVLREVQEAIRDGRLL